MPLFKKKLTNDQKKVLQEKLRLAVDKPDVIYDLANIGINKIPEGVFSKCKVLQKQALLLQNNCLEDFKSGGDLNDLSCLLVLDISHNSFTSIPKSINHLTSLQKLDISHNKLKKLPDEIGALKELQVLNVSNNQLAGLPATIKNFRKLDTLDISENRFLTNLPANLCYLKELKNFRFDLARITYPAKEITSYGIEEIIRWFKKLKGDEFMLDNDECDGRPPSKSPSFSGSSPIPEDQTKFEEAILERERQKEEKYKERLRLEQEIFDVQTENATLVLNAQKERAEFLTQIEKSEMEAQTALARQFDNENHERNKLLEQLYLEENHLDDTVNLVLQMSERAKHTDALLEELEQEQSRIDALVKITQEESERLRKQEMIEAMSYVLNEMEQSRRKFDEYEAQKEASLKKSIKSTEEDDHTLQDVLHRKDKEQQTLMQQIITEEEKQKSAFQLLQFQKDAKLIRIKKQVDLIEAELARLSLLEMQKRQEKNEQEINTLAEMRIQTAVLLSQLIDEQEQREQRLKETVSQMEEKREDDAKDYWLIQFQRLLESKPQLLIDEENRLDVFVVDILLHAHAKEYLPHFARHRIDELKMRAMTKERLREIGVKDGKVQTDILAGVKSAVLMNDDFIKREATFVKPEKEATTPVSDLRENPIPPHGMPTASALPAMNVCGASECVVCMDRRPEVVFLTCGHVCTCSICSQPLNDCPICRQTIIQKCRLFSV